MSWSFNHGNSSFEKSSESYPPRDLTDAELLERSLMIKPIDLHSVILRGDSALHEATNSRLLELFARDDSWLVRSCAFQNPAIPQSLREEIATRGLSRYAITEEWRGWRDFDRVANHVTADRIARLLTFPVHYRDIKSQVLWRLIDRLPISYPLPVETQEHMVLVGKEKTHRRLIQRKDLISELSVWYLLADIANAENQWTMQHDPDVPEIVRVYVAVACKPREPRGY